MIRVYFFQLRERETLAYFVANQRTFGFMDTVIVIVARQEEKKGWSFECLSVLVTLKHSFMDDNEERNLAERLLSCSRVISSAGFMDGEKEILELLFPCRENSFSSAPHCLRIPRPLPSPPPPRQ